MPRWTKRRVPALQIWPEFWNTAIAAPGTAASRSASAKTMSGDLPPSSIDMRLRLPAAARMIFCPTSVEPVNAILSTPGCGAGAAPGAGEVLLPARGRAAERDLAHAGGRGERGAGVAEAGDDVDHAFGDAR